ncbi:pleckstrin homology domain-containing 1-like [Micractinium conductrix]|uniref:Pleckstrin homology domain-containing 1-like n=1 Tax=Micractinium conductrix TaxID=554055 RepID=A0A2P6VAZ3_9CHLO|nr:pleckstrin homology domain-containing 1-like [Micractinium conductrix]|eukprot:PSC71238.1 pleckstrin homology domain-containing 1-like [Micractinium conductrix]
MDSASQLLNKALGRTANSEGVQFWSNPERCGWLLKQGEFIKTWRRRWFILKDGKIFWFKSDIVGPSSQPRGVIEVDRCLSIKGAEDAINRPHAFEISTTDQNMYFIADSDKDKEDWINAVGRAIVRHSKSMMDREQADYSGY